MKKSAFLLLAALLLAAAPFLAAQPAAPKAETPILLTSCGQSPGVGMMSVILRKVGLAYDLSPLATTADLKAKPYKTLIVVMGASLKGMGAAGIAIEDELKRTGALIDEARKLKMKVIGAHVEGMKRRAQGADAGDTTDEQSIDAVAPRADILLVWKDGNTDGRFSAIAAAKKLALIEFEKQLDMVKICETLFK
ncbi:MAG: DUF6305 family protein [Acidobacteriota bacterium]|nr:DUF6305 family protein [Acidobacteriota bacterium]